MTLLQESIRQSYPKNEYGKAMSVHEMKCKLAEHGVHFEEVAFIPDQMDPNGEPISFKQNANRTSLSTNIWLILESRSLLNNQN